LLFPLPRVLFSLVFSWLDSPSVRSQNSSLIPQEFSPSQLPTRFPSHSFLHDTMTPLNSVVIIKYLRPGEFTKNTSWLSSWFCRLGSPRDWCQHLVMESVEGITWRDRTSVLDRAHFYNKATVKITWIHEQALTIQSPPNPAALGTKFLTSEGQIQT
jgi:hypothetical protein